MISDFADLGIEIPFAGGGEVRAFCPHCAEFHRNRNKTLSVNTERGVFVCHRCGFKGRVGSRVLRSDMLDKIRAADARKALEHCAAAKRARALWDKAKPAMFHPYLACKRVLPFGLRQLGGALLVPMVDVRGELLNVQRIWPSGRKRWLKGGRVVGLIHAIRRRDDCEDRAIYVAEGYATAAALHMRFTNGAAVAVAFAAGNLKPVTLALREAYPRTELVIAADNDAHTAGNPGLTKARDAAAAAGGLRVIWPTFDGFDTSGRPTDFNDLHCLRCETEGNDG